MKKKIMRGLALIVSLILISGLYILYSAFYGNPIKKWTLRSSLIRYAEEHHPDERAQYSQVRYNFKDSQYYINVTINGSEDEAYTVSYYAARKEYDDDYRWRVIDRYNTWSRLEMEYRSFIDEQLAAYPIEFELSFGTLDQEMTQIHHLELNSEIDFYNPPLNTSLIVWIQSEQITVDELEKQLIDLYTHFQRRGIRIDDISLTLRNADNHSEDLMVHNFLTERILENPNLREELQANIDKIYNSDEK